VPLPHFCSVTNNRIVREQDGRPRRTCRRALAGPGPSAPGSPEPATGQGAGQLSVCLAPRPAGSGRFLRRVRSPGSSSRRPESGAGMTGRAAGVSIDRREGEPPGGAGVGPLRVGDGADVASRPSGRGRQGILRKEVIQPQVPLRLPCYDLVPITGLTFGACRLRRRRLRVPPALVA
jgi:hypothetical protein